METIEKIKAEIERKQQENLAQFNKGLINIDILTARDSQLLHIRTFVESLEKELSSNKEKDLWFQVAINALQGILEAKLGILGEIAPALLAEDCFRIADAFMKEYQKRQKDEHSEF